MVHRAIASFKNDPETWGLALAEAALRYTLVAEMLAGEPLDDGMTGVSTGRWADLPILAGTVYGQVLNFATSVPANDPRLAGLVKLPILTTFEVGILRETLEMYVRACVNLGARYNFGFVGVPLCEMKDNDGATVWGPPSLLEDPSSSIVDCQRRHPELEMHAFGPASSREYSAYGAVILLSIKEPIVRLSNIKSGMSFPVGYPRTWMSSVRRSLSRVGRRAHVR